MDKVVIGMYGIHVNPVVVKIAMQAKGLNKVVLVSDSSQAAGVGDGAYLRPGNRKIIVKDGVARLESGSLAGSTLKMNQAVRNSVTMLGLSLPEAIQLATLNAAQSLGIQEDYGSLEPGKKADVLIIDKDVNVLATMVDGNIVHTGDQFQPKA